LGERGLRRAIASFDKQNGGAHHSSISPKTYQENVRKNVPATAVKSCGAIVCIIAKPLIWFAEAILACNLCFSINQFLKMFTTEDFSAELSKHAILGQSKK
jgi:hypothetical protein